MREKQPATRVPAAVPVWVRLLPKNLNLGVQTSCSETGFPWYLLRAWRASPALARPGSGCRLFYPRNMIYLLHLLDSSGIERAYWRAGF